MPQRRLDTLLKIYLICLAYLCDDHRMHYETALRVPFTKREALRVVDCFVSQLLSAKELLNGLNQQAQIEWVATRLEAMGKPALRAEEYRVMYNDAMHVVRIYRGKWSHVCMNYN